MINREWKDVTVIGFSDEVDEYGQRRTGQNTERTIQAVVKVYAQSSVADPRYVDVELIALTKDQDVTTKNQVIIDGIPYDVLYIVPASRMVQLFLRKRQ